MEKFSTEEICGRTDTRGLKKTQSAQRTNGEEDFSKDGELDTSSLAEPRTVSQETNEKKIEREQL